MSKTPNTVFAYIAHAVHLQNGTVTGFFTFSLVTRLADDDIKHWHGVSANQEESISTKCERPSHRFHPDLSTFSVLVAAVVMEIDVGPASAPGAVAMEMHSEAATKDVKESESIARLDTEEPQDPHQHPGQQRRRGPPFSEGSYCMLIVIGEIATDHQLQAVKEHIKQGE